jgi:MFS family permease
VTAEASAWAPLRIAAYRNLWLALLAANVGTWMQTVGAQWLLVDAPNAALLVALVQTAATAPVLLLALPAGVLADAFDRRHLLVAVQAFLSAVGLVMTCLTATGGMRPPLLLTLTFALGVGHALTLPAWAATIPELVPREQLRAASALGSISVNVARSVGPAIAGLLVARTGASVVFAVNTATYLVFGAVLLLWRPGSPRADDVPERLRSALRAGGRFVRHSPVLQRMLLRVVLFILPGSAVWALLPLVASDLLHLDSNGYGLLLAALGAGAIGGGLLLPWVRSRVSSGPLLVMAGVPFAAVLFVVAAVREPWAVAAALVVAGGAWAIVLANLNAEIQLFLPRWVRGRGLAVYQLVFGGGQALGGLAWGAVAEIFGVVAAYLAATGLMLANAGTMWLWPLPDLRGVSQQPVDFWPEPRLAVEPDRRAGPVLVVGLYEVPPEREDAFVEAMRRVRGSRQRTGAVRWGLFRVGEEAHLFVEIYELLSWDEHLRQHEGRMTVTDQQAEQYAHALTDGVPRVWHLLPAVSLDRWR